MTTYYDREYPVSKWIIATGLTKKQQEMLVSAASKNNALVVPWPALEMPAELTSLAKNGYDEQVNQAKPFFLDMVLALRAMVNITRRNNPFAQISNKPPYHHVCKNRIETDECVVRLANEILAANDPITLSQVFNTADTCHLTYVSIDGDKKTIQKMAKEIVTLGNSDEFDINLKDLLPKDALAAITNLF